MESPPPALFFSACSGFSSDGDSGLLLTASDSLSSCSSNWQYTMESVDSEEEVDKFLLSSSPVVNVCNDDDGVEDDNNVVFDYDEQFNTVLKKKEKNLDRNLIAIGYSSIEQPIDPPLEFQDVPAPQIKSDHRRLEQLAEGLVDQIVNEAVTRSRWRKEQHVARLCSTPEPPQLSSLRRPPSRNSLNSRLSSSHNSLSMPTANKADDSSFITSAMSHDVLDMYNVSMDSDMYALPVDSLKPPKRQHRHHRKHRRDTSDLTQSSRCATVTPTNLVKQIDDIVSPPSIRLIADYPIELTSRSSVDKRHSLPSTSMSGYIGKAHCTEPIHMTLQEVRRFLHNLYSSASTAMDQPENECLQTMDRGKRENHFNGDNLRTKVAVNGESILRPIVGSNNNNNNNNKPYLTSNRKHRYNKNMFAINIKNRKSKVINNENDFINSLNNNNINNNLNNNDGGDHGDGAIVNNKLSDLTSNSSRVINKIRKGDLSSIGDNNHSNISGSSNTSLEGNNRSHCSGCTKNSFSYTLRQTLCNIFKFARKSHVPSHCHHSVTDTVLVLGVSSSVGSENQPPFVKRALPPLPSHNKNTDCLISADEINDDCKQTLAQDRLRSSSSEEETTLDFASSIEKVKDYGWYWGPICGETAEKILSNEPDGSFIVRDSSDDHYIFSLTFKLNGVVRHVRIEHDQGNFSFGSCTKFKSHTIVEFIENAVEHSRSGRYLFFLHRRPVHGPMRVQLLHPVSRFKQVQSLQHMCRFVILKVVRRDLIPSLPLPRRIIDYLNSPYYYSEHPSLPPPEDNRPSSSPSLHVFSFMPPMPSS